MDQNQLLSYYGKEIILAINPNLIDRLSCDICSEDFNENNKKPVKMCLNSHESQGVCLQCYNKQSQKVEPKCYFCRAQLLTPPSDDFDRQQKVKARYNLFKKLNQLSRNTKQMTKTQSEKKLKEIIDRAEKDMGKTTEQSKKRALQIERLRAKLKRMMQNEQQKERAAIELSKREQELFEREKQHKETMQKYMKDRLLMQNQLFLKEEEIEKLKKQNRELKLRLKDNSQIEQLEERIGRKRRADTLTYNDNQYFRSFKFNPERHQGFIDYFLELKDSRMIQLNQSKELEFRGDGTRKMLFHSQIFDAAREEDRLICFKVKAHNKRAPVYKFGISDEHNKEFKDAYLSLFLKHDQNYEFPYEITFYVNLLNRKLYATSPKEKNSKQLPQNLKLSKFKVYVYFSDLKTQLTFHK